jgi:eukaryotic-like serine/threonine-protein kinase
LEPQILKWKIAAAVCAAAAALLVWRLGIELRRPPPSPPPAVRLLIPPPDSAAFGAGTEPLDATLSPDGGEMVFVATSNGAAQLWRRQLAGDRAQPIGGTEGARQPAWIAGQRAVSFWVGDSLKRTTLEGVVTEVATIPNAAGAAWFEDGSVLVGHARGPVRRWRDGRETPVSRLQDGDTGHRFPWRVDEQTWLYLAERANGRRVVRVVRDGAERDVADADGHAMAAGGWLLYPRGGALLAQPLADDGVVGGRARPLIVGVGVSTEGRAFAALSSRVAVFSPPSGQQHRLQWFDGSGTALAIASEPGDYWQVRLSPDDRQAAVTMLEPLLRTLDVYVLRNGSGAPVPVTLGLAADTDPVWSADGRTLLFRSVRNGQARLFTREVGRTGAAETPLLGAAADKSYANAVPSEWTRAGDIFFSATSGSRPNTDVFRVPIAAREPAAAVATGFNESAARLSPDGRWVAYVTDESGQEDVYVSGWPQGPRTRVSQAGGSHPRWSGSSLFFLRDDEVLRATRQPGAAPTFDVPQRVLTVPGLRDFDVAHTGDRLLVVVPAASARPPDVGALVDWQTALITAP